MVVADPGAELLRLVTGGGADTAPPIEASAGDRRSAELIRRRFGLALPPPFACVPGRDEPVRRAVATDGAAIAAVKWRAFGASYRGGVLSDAFLDRREVAPPPPFWVGRAMLPPSRRHRLLVWGRPGTVFGYADTGPVHDDDANAERAEAGEVYELYVDPMAQRRGGGARLLAATEEEMVDWGAHWAELSVLDTNTDARAFYEAGGWVDTGQLTHVDLATVAFDERRLARRLRTGPS